jgi:hypothetical protein
VPVGGAGGRDGVGEQRRGERGGAGARRGHRWRARGRRRRRGEGGEAESGGARRSNAAMERVRERESFYGFYQSEANRPIAKEEAFFCLWSWCRRFPFSFSFCGF